MAIMLGNDVSIYEPVNFDVYKNNSNFLLMKATEGTGFTDNNFSHNQSEVRRVGLPCGFYHFARPDLGNTPQAEADWFTKIVGPLKDGEILILDYEVSYADPVTWCKKFLDAVHESTTVKPLIYLNQSLIQNHDWSPLSNDYGLWVAAFTYDPMKNNFAVGSWKNAAMQQWTDKQTVPGIDGDVDGDVFFGDSSAFAAYGYHKPAPPIDPRDQQIKDLQQQVSTLQSQVLGMTQTIAVLHDQLSECQTKPPVVIPQKFSKPLAQLFYNFAVTLEGS